MSDWEARFWSKVDRRASNECWPWRAGTTRGGYGGFSIRHGTMQAAHRLSWELEHGPIPDGLWVLHHCDNPPCVNPAHLYVGTRADNTRDMVVRRRHWAHRGLDYAHRGEANGRAKLTADDVRAIRARYAAGETQTALAPEYGVSRGQIGHVIQGRAWVAA